MAAKLEVITIFLILLPSALAALSTFSVPFLAGLSSSSSPFVTLNV